MSIIVGRDTVKDGPPHSVKEKLVKSVKDLAGSKMSRRKVDESYFKEIKGKEHWIVYLMIQAFDELETEFYTEISSMEEKQSRFNMQVLEAMKEERGALIEMRDFLMNSMEELKSGLNTMMDERLAGMEDGLNKQISELVEESMKPALSGMEEKINSLSESIENIVMNGADSYKIISHNQESITKLSMKLDEMSEDIAALDERIGIEISRIPGVDGSMEALKDLASSIEAIKSISADLEGMKEAVAQMSKIKDLAHVSEEIQGMKDDISKALEGLDVKEQVEELAKKLESIDTEGLSKSIKELEDIGNMAAKIDEIRRRLSSIEELSDFQAQIDDLQKRMLSIKELEEEMKKDMDILRRLVGEFEEMTSVTQMLGELEERVKRVEEYGKKLDALDIESLNSMKGAPGISSELGEKIDALASAKGSAPDMEPVKDEIESMKKQVAEIEKKVDMILKSTNRHLDIMEKNLKAEIEKIKNSE